MVTFYLIAGGAAVVAAFLLVRPLVFSRGQVAGQDSTDAQVFRDQLAEIDRDLDRGTISEAEAEGARVEVSRRLLAANARAEKLGELAPAPQGHSGLIAGLALMGTPALAAALYFGIGAPGMSDQPLAERRAAAQSGLPAGHAQVQRPGQEEAEAQITAELPPAPLTEDQQEYVELVERLQGVVREQPQDAKGRQLLADGLMRLGRWSEAWREFDALIEILGNRADADLHATKAEMMVLAAGGYVSPEAEAAIDRALRLDPTLPLARYYGGLALRQAGRLDDAITMWEGLRRDTPAGAPYLDYLNMMLSETIQARDGVAPGPGPSAADMAAADEMSAEDRMEMIEGMVQRLADRLAEQGGSVDEWGRLMSSYATLDRPEKAQAAFDAAIAAYPSGPEGDALRAHAANLGLEGGVAAAPAPGPTQEDVDAAQEMSAEDRQAMIAGMVQRLDDRLTEEGGAPDDWRRLMTSYATLGNTEMALDAYERAQAAYPSGQDGADIEAHAARLGLISTSSAPGPTQADITAAQQMTAEDRAAMIEGMVARLEDRLTSDGGTAEEWLRLIRSYVQLEKKDDAARVFRLADADLSAKSDPSRGFVKEQTLLMGVSIE